MKVKPFEPDVEEFIEALHVYGEMQFEYQGVHYAVELVEHENVKIKISLYNSQTKEVTIFNYSKYKDYSWDNEIL